MNIQTVTKANAVERLQSEEVRLFQEGRTSRAEELATARRTLERGRGETLWDVYRNAGDRFELAQSATNLIFPEVEPTSGAFMAKHAAMIGLGAAACGVANYLRGGSIGWSIGAAMIPLGIGFFATGPLLSMAEGGVDVSLPMSGAIAATSAVAVATRQWLPPIATLVGIAVASVGTTMLAVWVAERQKQIQTVIDENKDLFAQAPDPKAELGRRISKKDMLATMVRMQDQALAQGDFSKAMELRSGLRALKKCPGTNFHEMLLGSDASQRQLLSTYAVPILEDARQRAEIEELVRGSESRAELLIGLDTVTVGEHELAVSS